MRYKASFDAVVKIITNAMLLFALGLLCLQTFTPMGHTGGGWIALCIMLAAILLSWGLHPQYYWVSDRTIHVMRPFGRLRIPLEDVIHVRPLLNDELGLSYRRFGVGGLFGYLGWYKSSNIGVYQVWATHRDRLVVIETAKGKFVISPDAPIHFTNDVNSRRYRR